MAQTHGVLQHLSAEGTFLMGDVQAPGFPIPYASTGFEQTCGYLPADIVGKKCGEVIGGPMIKTKSDGLAQLVSKAGVSLESGARMW